MIDHPAMRAYAKRNTSKEWYSKFCDAFDIGVREAQRTIRNYPKTFERLKELSSNYYEGKPGYPLDRFELFVLRWPESSTVCAQCSGPKPAWKPTCSVKCGALSCVDKRRSTNIKLYGADNPSRVEEFKDKRTKAIRKKYGVDNAFQSKALHKKSKRTVHMKYGVDNVSQSAAIKNKKEATMTANYGVNHWTKSRDMAHKLRPFTPDMLQKAKITCLAKYGVDNPFKSKEIQAATRATCIERYGIANPGSIPNGYKRKMVIDKFGKRHVVQGYETHAIEFFERVPTVTRIETKSRNVPNFGYKSADNRRRRYYPDMIVYAGAQCHVVEVKSSYTLRLDLDNNLCKFRAATTKCQKRGRNFWLFYFTDDLKLLRVKNPKTIDDLRKKGIPV